MMAMCTTAASVSSASSSLPSPTSSSQVTSAAEAVSRIVASEPEDATIEELGRATASACNLIDDDFAGSSDEVKIFKDEGEDEEKEYVSQEELQAALSEDKSSLIQETELSIKQEALRLTDSSIGIPNPPSKVCHPSTEDSGSPGGSPFSGNGYLMSPYNSYGLSAAINSAVGEPGSNQTTTSVRTPGSPTSSSAAFLYNSDPLGSPPPAHMGGIPYSLDPSKGLRPPLYPLHPGSYPYSLLSPSEMSQFSPWSHSPPTNPTISAAAAASLIMSALTSWRYQQQQQFLFQSLSSPLSRCGGAPGAGGLLSSPPTPGSTSFPPHSQSLLSSAEGHGPSQNTASVSLSGTPRSRSAREREREDKRSVHIKKPLNAFMLYMKEMRPKIVAECTLKESAAINQILGRRWHSLSREEQAKYYEQARKERQLHMQMYPGWSARDNYAQSKKKKRKRESETTVSTVSGQKKCRARYGLEQQDRWCKPCNRGGASGSSSLGLNNGLESAATASSAAAAAIMAGQTLSNAGNGIYLNDLTSLASMTSDQPLQQSQQHQPQTMPPLPSVLDMDGLAATVSGHTQSMHSNNNNNMIISAGPSPSSCSISPTSASTAATSDILPHTSVALAAAAAAAAVSSMEAMGFIDHQHMTATSVANHKMTTAPDKEAAGANGDGSSPKYISL